MSIAKASHVGPKSRISPFRLLGLLVCVWGAAACDPGEADPCGPGGKCAKDLVCFKASFNGQGSCQTNAGADEGCKKLPACAAEGRCKYFAVGSMCIATAEGCSQSTKCKTDGLCSMDGGTNCSVSDDADCAQSKGCREGKKCKAKTLAGDIKYCGQ